MMKGRKKNNFSNTNRKTLDVQHAIFIQEMNDAHQEINKLKDKIHLLNTKIAKIDSKKEKNDQDIDYKIKCVDEKIDIESELQNLEHKYDEQEYFTNTANVLYKYFDLQQNGVTSDTNANGNSKTDNKNSVLNYFNKVKNYSVSSISEDDNENNNNNKKNKNKQDTKTSLLDMYLQTMDNNYLPQNVQSVNDCCPVCKSKQVVLMTNDGYLMCLDCNLVENVIIDDQKPSYKDPPKEISYFCYKRGNHLNEWISQIQGKETTDIPDDVFDMIHLEFKKQRIHNMATLSPQKLRDVLKKLNLNKYYEHVPHILFRLNGKENPNFEPEFEEKLRNMFAQLQGPFVKYRKTYRKNFLSYSYVLHKIFQLLEKDDYLSSVNLLKSRDKLMGQDEIWKLICKDLGWEFIRSL